MTTNPIKSILEALIFASEEPIGLATMAGILGEAAAKPQIQSALAELMSEYNENPAKGLMLRELDGAYQFVTKPEAAPYLQKLAVDKPKTLSQAALETLSVIAYRQPLVRSDIEQIRGVDCGGVLKTLLERGLIKIIGRREEAGQPLIYATTPAFLELFHLTRLEELPSMKEIEQIVEESQKAKGEAPEAAPEAVSEEGLETDASQETVCQDAAFHGALPEEEAALGELEASLKDLRKLEREIFPQEKPAETPAEPADPNESSESKTDPA